jgi:hypothetical protein
MIPDAARAVFTGAGTGDHVRVEVQLPSRKEGKSAAGEALAVDGIPFILMTNPTR